jgi:hypothetical protein
MARVLTWFLSWLSLECLLKCHPNGGGIILVRSVFVGTLIFAVAITLRWVLPTEETHCWWRIAGDNLPWLGAAVGGAYAAFYTRFASQWAYLAGLYNQIKQTECQLDCEHAPVELAQWKAGFIEDCEELHLAGKRLFASVILEWLKSEDVRTEFKKFYSDADARLKNIEKKALKAEPSHTTRCHVTNERNGKDQ